MADETQPTVPAPAMTEAAVQALREMHPDPFVQAAIWRLYVDAPGLLDQAPVVCLTAVVEGE